MNIDQMLRPAGPTREQTTAALMACKTFADAIRELGSVPSGHLYANVIGHMDLPTYERIIETLKRAGLVAEKNHLLTWVGPKL
jgi:hypothetical protein